VKYLLDTNICIYVINGRSPGVLEKFDEHPLGAIGISTITASELAFGVAKSGSDKNRRALEKFLAPLEVVSFDREVIWAYGTLRATLERKGRPIGSLDTLIAAHALALDVTLVTNDVSEFERVPGLKVENWALSG
jgi:tRNA(fMet)-specific endonuclease VapC